MRRKRQKAIKNVEKKKMLINEIKCTLAECPHYHAWHNGKYPTDGRLCAYYPNLSTTHCNKWTRIDEFKLFLAIHKEKRNVEKL